jgi:hypothetical protein
LVFTPSGDDKQPDLCLSESRVYMPFTAHLSPPPLTQVPKPRGKPAASFRAAEVVHLVFSEWEREDLERSVEAVGRRRALRLIRGTKASSKEGSR